MQSPTLALVVKRDDTIKNFKPQDYYLLDTAFTTVEGEAYKGRWVAGDEVGCDEEGRVTDRKYTESVQSEVQASGKGVISQYEKLTKSTPQPVGLSLSDITLKASNRFGMTADGVLKTVQSL